jgi:hypothetical protein
VGTDFSATAATDTFDAAGVPEVHALRVAVAASSSVTPKVEPVDERIVISPP